MRARDIIWVVLIMVAVLFYGVTHHETPSLNEMDDFGYTPFP